MEKRLLTMMDQYLALLVTNDPSSLPVAADLRVTENGYPITLGQGLFETAREITYKHTITDPANGQIREIEALMTNIPLGAPPVGRIEPIGVKIIHMNP